MGKGRMILQRLADGADLSAEPLPGAAIVEIAGDRRVLIENHFGDQGIQPGENRSQGEIRSGLCLRL